MKLQITTGAYSAPYICEGSKCETDKALIYEWCEEHDPGEGISNYKLTYLKAGKTVLLQRTGLIRSELKFEAGIRTRGSIETGYGVMDLNIETDYINIPNIFSRTFEISYRLRENSDLNVNKFIICEL